MRYFKATLVIGIIAACAVMLLYATGWVQTPDAAFRQLLSRSMRITADIPSWGQYACIALFAFAATWTTVDIGRPALKAVVAISGVFACITGSLVLALYGVFWTPFPSVAAILAGFCLGLGYGRSDSGSRKKVLQRLFGTRLSRPMLGRLVDSNVPIHFPGSEQDATVLVCEVHNHVDLLQSLEPSEYAALTNLYLRTASDFLVEAGGYLDECGGESLRVVFGAPLPDEDHASAACKAALQLAVRLEALNVEIDSKWRKRLDYRLGINSGPTVAAAYGGTRLGSFSVAGPAVEFARRLCAACAVYGCRVLIGPETFRLAREQFEARPIELVKRPDNTRIELYEILSRKNGLSPERAKSRDHFWRGVIYFRERKWEQAIEEFAKARITGIPDLALDHYILRVQRSRRGDVDVDREQMVLSA